MNCPACNAKMKCVDSRQINPRQRTRIYLCRPCNDRYISIETLDIGKLPQKRPYERKEAKDV